MRLDVYLSETKMAKSRSYAAELIKKGLVKVNGKPVTKPSFDVDGEKIEVSEDLYSFVGRGGVKLDGALTLFGIDVSGLICVDVGASTGGFTDCLLSRGAKKVYAVDCGHGQLDKKLLDDKRVINMEGINARNISPVIIGEMCDMAVCDLSFISQTYVTEQVASVLKNGGLFLSLVKPQFECGRSALGKGGIVKDRKYYREAILRVQKNAAEHGLVCTDIARSCILGGDGNLEFTALFCKSDCAMPVGENKLREVVG